jgi:PelA/Pel-15E family pectate lyase
MSPTRLGFAMALLLAASPELEAAPARDRAAVLAAMKRATSVMVGKIGYQGGYVWNYLPDLTRRWGEMEATPTMMWLQGPGTLSVGHTLLDAHRATGDEYYYNAARLTAQAVIRAQHKSGGWNYVADLAGEESLRRWYDTVGKNGWRLEEFQHYYGNATFDDSTTADAASFMLRFYLQKRDGAAKRSLDQAIGFVLKSQYENGGWPQRYPEAGPFSKNGNPDYTGFITFNDNVAGANVDFLIDCYSALGDRSLLEPIHRGMNVYLLTRQDPPQAGWALQHTKDLKPEGARTYEPRALATHTTGSNVAELLRFYALTGDPKFLKKVPDALAWLDSVKLPEGPLRARGTHPTFIELGTNKPLFIHRTGSNVTNGRYFADYDPQATVGHYSSFRTVDVEGLRKRYEKALATPPFEAAADSPLRPGAKRNDRLIGRRATVGQGAESVEAVVEGADRAIASLSPEGYWLQPLRTTSHPYRGDGPLEVAPGDFRSTNVGDDSDTSPFQAAEPVMGISVATFTRNMGALIRYLEAKRPQ